MSERVYIRLPSDPDAELVWLRADAPDQVRSDPLSALDTQSPVTVFVPTAQLLLCDAKVPTRNRARMRQAIPYALEEQLAQDIDQLHFALGAPADEQGPTAVIARATLDEWLARLQAAGIEPESLVPDVCALPWQDGQWTLLLEDHGVLARTGAARGWAADHDNLAWLLDAELRQHGAPARVRVLSTQPDADLALGLPPETEVSRDTLAGYPLSLFARHHDRARSIDLLQGPYQRGTAHADQRKRWRWVAALAAVLVAVEVGGAWYEHARLQQELQRAQAQIETEFRAVFPRVQRIVEPKAQMQQELQRLRSGEGGSDGVFLALLADAAPALTGPGALRITRLQYRDRQLELDLDAPSFQALDRIKQVLSEQGLSAEILSASAAGQGVSGRLRIRRDAS